MNDPTPTSWELAQRLHTDLAALQRYCRSDRPDEDTTPPSGTGEAMSGRIRVRVTGGRVSEVEIDPRARRKPSAELAAAVRDATNAAIGNHTAQASASLPNAPSLEELSATLHEISADSARTMEESERGIQDALRAVQHISQLRQRAPGNPPRP